MKQLFLSIILSIVYQFGFSKHDINVASKIKKVTVSLNGAQVFRTGNVQLKKGINYLTFNGVSPKLNPESVRASGNGNFMILDVKHNVAYPEPLSGKVLPQKFQKEVKQLQDSILRNRFEIERIKENKQNIINEKNLLKNNKIMTISDTLTELKESLKFYRNRLEGIEDLIFEIKLEEHQLEERKIRMGKRLKDLENYRTSINNSNAERKSIPQVLVTISSNIVTTGKITVSYMVNDARWVPEYDLRAENTVKPILLTYKARVSQNTGEDWFGVNLTLSTYNQDYSFSKPVLPSWIVDYASEKKKITMSSLNFYNTKSNTTSAISLNNQLNDGRHNSFSVSEEYDNLSESFTKTEFQVKSVRDISSNGEEVLMVIKNEEIPANYDFFAVPKLNKDAFLLAKVSDWQKLNLFHAKTNVYFENTFVGETIIDPLTPKDTLEIALGKDRRIYTTRNKIEDKTKSSKISKTQTRTITIELIVKNNKTRPVSISLEDQIPISKKDEIKVKLIDSGDGLLNKEMGLLKWELGLEPNQSKKIRFTYSIESKKGSQVL